MKVPDHTPILKSKITGQNHQFPFSRWGGQRIWIDTTSTMPVWDQAHQHIRKALGSYYGFPVLHNHELSYCDLTSWPSHRITRGVSKRNYRNIFDCEQRPVFKMGILRRPEESPPCFPYPQDTQQALESYAQHKFVQHVQLTLDCCQNTSGETSYLIHFTLFAQSKSCSGNHR